MNAKMRLVGKNRWDTFKINAKMRFQDFKIWCYNNRDIVVPIAITAITAGVPFIVKKAFKFRELRKTENLKNLYCYDRSLGHYWKLRRELSNDEWVLIDKRKANGERLADILDELKVLK